MSQGRRRTGYVWDEIFAWHDTGMAGAFVPTGFPVEPEPHVESPASKRRLNGLVQTSGMARELVAIPPRPATREEILRLHTPDYVDRIEKLSAGTGGDAGDGTPFGHGSFEIACLAAGGCLAAVEAVLSGIVDNAYAMVRPPGHHAEPDTGRGFCIFGNVALAALHARRAGDLDRVAIVDWDVHHGNGSERTFREDPSVLTISLHQDSLYPFDSGGADEVGSGAGAGYNINLPLPPGSGIGAYETAFERVIAPALRTFRPELILVASGLDAGAMDPLGRMILISDDYRTLTGYVLDLADELCSGRLVVCHEGGYSSIYVPFCGLAVIETLAGYRTGVEDPFIEELAGTVYRELQSHQEAVIDRVAGMLDAGELLPAP